MVKERGESYVKEVATVESGSDSSETGDILDAAGNATHKYNDTDDSNVASADAETFINTNLGAVTECTVSIHTDDSSIGNGQHTAVAEAQPASASDYNSDSDYVDGTILINLVDPGDDANSPQEVSDDTDISSMKFTYTAYYE